MESFKEGMNDISKAIGLMWPAESKRKPEQKCDLLN